MGKIDLSTSLAALAALPEAFEKYPRGAMWVGGLIALWIVCYTIISVHNKRS